MVRASSPVNTRSILNNTWQAAIGAVHKCDTGFLGLESRFSIILDWNCASRTRAQSNGAQSLV